ncbi:MAG: AI-2E family transporter [Nanoarchaeota archaeon]|nr:AI-2E family transporter [Nanoarchaeota archaeon]
MSITNREIRRLSVLALISLLVVLSFLVLRPILLSITTGLILAYAFIPVYKRIYSVLKEKNTSALAVSILVLLILFIPAWFLIPLVIQQAFDMFTFTQTIDIVGFVNKIFPAASEQFQKEITSVAINFIGKITSASLNALVGFLLELPTVLLHLAVIIFVFFFTLRDHEKLAEFVSGISPFKKEKEKILVKQFKEITSSIVFGYVVIGIIQGIVTGIGLLIFGVPKAILLTIFAIFASIIPMIGPWLIWVPAAIFLFATGGAGAAIGFTLYSAILVSSIDNILRPYIVARKTGISPVIVLVGMIGGLFVFGILGILLGPLILSYLILFLRAYKERTLSDMFSPE